jgi:group I intron endonuclease
LKLQNAFTKHGEDNFVFEIIEHCTEENLIEREQHYLDQRPEYNISFIAGPKTRYGLKSTPEHLANMSKALKGRISPMKGKKFTVEHKQRLSESNKNKHIGNTSRRIDLTGKNFGKWFVIGPGKRNAEGKLWWRVRCRCCNTEKEVEGSLLRNGRSRSCGSIKRNSKEWRRNANSTRFRW